MVQSNKVKIEETPLSFRKDQEWALENYQRFMKEYPDQWIAIYDEKVVATGEDLTSVEEAAKKVTGLDSENIPVLYIERSFRVL
jgi:hypothetical protein